MLTLSQTSAGMVRTSIHADGQFQTCFVLNCTGSHSKSKFALFGHSYIPEWWGLWRLISQCVYRHYRKYLQLSKTLKPPLKHSVESPSMVDPQWNIWYWGSKRNLHTVCWSAVGCEWGTTSVYFGITYVCLIPSRLPVFVVEPQYLLQYFLFLSKVSFELHIQNLQKISCWFKIWMGFVGPILIKLWTSSIWGFL